MGGKLVKLKSAHEEEGQNHAAEKDAAEKDALLLEALAKSDLEQL